MNRIRFIDWRTSRGPRELGICPEDVAGCAEYVNSAQRRLILAREAGDTGWWGSWARMAYTLTQANPYIVTPREVARLVNMSVCNHNINIQNEFYEFLEFGIGPQPRNCAGVCKYLECYDRGQSVTFAPQTISPATIRVVCLNSDDGGKKAFIQGTDSAGAIINTQVGNDRFMGEFISTEVPFADSTELFATITGIQKDVTFGIVQFYEVDPDTGDQNLLLSMEPGETVASYRKYFVNGLPPNCCNNGETVAVECMAKLELIPARYDTDYLLIQNIEALIEESQSIRYGNVDTISAKKMALDKHVQAIRLLQGELVHYLGKTKPAVSFKPFGSANLERVKIAMT